MTSLTASSFDPFFASLEKVGKYAQSACNSSECKGQAAIVLQWLTEWKSLPSFANESTKISVARNSYAELIKLENLLRKQVSIETGRSSFTTQHNKESGCSIPFGRISVLDIPLSHDACNDCSATMAAATVICSLYMVVNPAAAAICESVAAGAYLDCLCRNKCSQVACIVTGGDQ